MNNQMPYLNAKKTMHAAEATKWLMTRVVRYFLFLKEKSRKRKAVVSHRKGQSSTRTLLNYDNLHIHTVAFVSFS